ncbi:sel1 repeat family protein [Campylobacter coli]|nr:sel1 repeat family protein [Campylobacter coli]HEF6234313.1 sel1 repeat family protein [Campylobacter jejuni]EAJ1075968.1 sel1 repeat family protein [Campylobacter coli]EAL3490033.1 sel1 repeat family protein [Campylobacter coli]EEU6677510.1 sel1 repeat family protein [Campylobacter coli]
MRIILALFIYIYAFGIDVCKEKEIEMSIYINKYTNAYENKNLGYSEEKLYKKSFSDCYDKKNKEACLYIYNNFAIDGNFKIESNIFNLITIMTYVGLTLDIDKDKKYKEINRLIALDSWKKASELIDFVLSETNDTKTIEGLKLLKEMSDFEINRAYACPLYYNDKLQSDAIDMPCACKKNTAFLLEPDTIRRAFLNLKLLCDKYKDSASCWAVGGLYENGKGVRINFKQAKKYYGLACDGGYQLACDGYKRLMGY